jgi:hypothetical protein
VLPLCYGVFESVEGADWLYERFGRLFVDIEAFFNWLGEGTRFGGDVSIQAVRLAALALGSI